MPHPASHGFAIGARLRFTTSHPAKAAMSLPPIFSRLPSNPPKPTQPEKPWSSSPGSGVTGIRIPTAPWMTSPLILPAGHILDLSNPRKKNPSTDDEDTASLRFLNSGVRGGRSREAMLKILKSVSGLRKIHPPPPEADDLPEENSGMKHTIPIDFSIPLAELDAISSANGVGVRRRKEPWASAREETVVYPRLNKKRILTKAEMVLPTVELERHREEAMKIRKWVRGKKAGVTPEVVKGIKRAWRKNELAMVKLVSPLRLNMVRAHEIVENKTDGLVVWRKNDFVVVYRGEKYEMPTKASPRPTVTCVAQSLSDANISISAVAVNGISTGAIVETRQADNSVSNDTVLESYGDPGLASASLYEREVNRLLDGLGPRFADWWQHKPLPVDADLLPAVVSGFKSPFRMCPPLARQKLSNEDLTYLRNLARPLPTHFALSKNTKLQGLASAIIKLWEKSLIAKIAIKVGIQNTNSQQMAKELKRLTGGILILRNKFFIILFRGKDFLPGKVSDSILEREAQVNGQHLLEENARSKSAESFQGISTSEINTSTTGTFREFKDIVANYIPVNNQLCMGNAQIAAEMENLKRTLREHEHSLFNLKAKIEKSQKILAQLNSSWSPSSFSADRELLTEEERESLRKIGLKMNKILLLGRRGIYDGVIESIRQHWKHREIVKVVTMQKATQQINQAARLLERESGGIVVAVEKQGRGHAIIIYRGRNYRRPLLPTHENLLTKRQALQRSLEVQRRGSLRFFAKERQRCILEMRRKLRDLLSRQKRAEGFHSIDPKHPEDRKDIVG